MSDACGRLHHLLAGLERFRFPFEPSKIPKNGTYVLYEAGEDGHGTRRIVRVGTHTGANQLPSRLQQHFVNESKDRSIFRKNIGRALLAKDHDEFLTQWDLDLTTRQARETVGGSIDLVKQAQVERRVTAFIQQNFEFLVLQEDQKDRRLELEARIISTVAACKACGPSATWLGLHSPKAKIRTSGLWLVNELSGAPLSITDHEEVAAKTLGLLGRSSGREPL